MYTLIISTDLGTGSTLELATGCFYFSIMKLGGLKRHTVHSGRKSGESNFLKRRKKKTEINQRALGSRNRTGEKKIFDRKEGTSRSLNIDTLRFRGNIMFEMIKHLYY